MIITKDIIFINLPKTGSTFVREVLKKLHTPNSFTGKLKKKILGDKYRYRVYRFPEIRTPNKRYQQPTEHGLYCQIPVSLLNGKQVISAKRNIYDYYLSLYFYADWKRPEAMIFTEKEIKSDFPSFPDLSFDEFVLFMQKFPFYSNNPKLKNSREIQHKLGPLSVQFVFFYFKNPFDFLNNLNQYDIHHLNYRELMPEITFLDQKKLNQELYHTLLNYYPEKSIRFILTENKKNVSNNNRLTKEQLSSEIKQQIERNEHLIYNFFNQYYI